MARWMTLALLGVASALVGQYVYQSWGAQRQQLPALAAHFQDVAPGLQRLGYGWKQLGGLLTVDINTFLVRAKAAHDGPAYILIDGGVPGVPYKELLLSAVKNATQDGQLRLMLLTHGHIDHVGALPAIMAEYPDIQVVVHESEARFVAGSGDYRKEASDTVVYKVVRGGFGHYNVTGSLPLTRVRLLTGKAGDVADATPAAGQATNWQLPKGLLRYYNTPGHAPGHVAYLLSDSSRSLILGDTVASLQGKDGPAPPVLSFPPKAFTPNNTQIILDAQYLATLDFDRAFPSHQMDRGPGLSKAQLQDFAAAQAV